MCTRNIKQELTFAWQETRAVFEDRLPLYQKLDWRGLLKNTVKGLASMERKRDSLDKVNRLLMSYQMIANLSILSYIDYEGNLGRYTPKLCVVTYQRVTRDLLYNLDASETLEWCALPLNNFNDLLRASGVSDRRKVLLGLVGVVKEIEAIKKIIGNGKD